MEISTTSLESKDSEPVQKEMETFKTWLKQKHSQLVSNGKTHNLFRMKCKHWQLLSNDMETFTSYLKLTHPLLV